MCKIQRCFFTLLLIVYALNSHAAIDPATLIQVTNENNPKCVAFYTYQNTLYCTTTPTPESAGIDPKLKDYEKQTIRFDERPWQAVWGKKTDSITVIEYVPAGDNIEDWYELVTSQFIPGLQNKTTPKQYAESSLEQLKKSGLQPIINIINDSPTTFTFEFRIISPKNLKQNELQLITQGSDGFYILHYVIKKSDMGQENRDKWLKNLQQSTIKSQK